MITGVVLAPIEGYNIVECLRALTPHVAEVLVIDMKSTDYTVDLARPIANRILPHQLTEL